MAAEGEGLDPAAEAPFVAAAVAVATDELEAAEVAAGLDDEAAPVLVVR